MGCPHLLANGAGAGEGEGSDAPLAQIFPFPALGEKFQFPTFGLVQVVAELGLGRAGIGGVNLKTPQKSPKSPK